MNKVILIVMMLAFMPIAHADDMMDVSRLKKDEVKWASLSDEQMARIKGIHEALAEVDQSSLDQWIDDFKRDTDPDREIAIWQHIAAVYAHAVQGKQVTLDYKKEAFKLVFASSIMPRKDVLDSVEPTILSAEEADAIMDEFYRSKENR